MPPLSFFGVVTKAGFMNKTASVTVSRWVIDAKTGKVRHHHQTQFHHESSICCAKSSASPGARNTWSTTRETARVTIPTAVTPNLSSCRAPCRGLGINTQLSSRLSTEAIHVGESCTQPRNRTRSCTRSRRNACHITITDTNTIGHSTLVVSRIVVSITVS